MHYRQLVNSELVLSIRNFTTVPVIFVITSLCCVNLQFFWNKKGLSQRFYATIFQDFNGVKFNVVKSEHCSAKVNFVRVLCSSFLSLLVIDFLGTISSFF